MIGSARVAGAAPDGSQFVFGGISTHAQVQSLSKNPRYNAATDFAPVALVAEQALVLVARKSIPVADLAAFIAYTRANQGTMQYGSPGAGSGSHLACALLNVALKINVTHVPYRGLGPAMTDLLGGRIDYMCPTITTGIAQIEAGQVHAPAVLTRQRSAALPRVSTAHEQGVTDFDTYSWNAIFLPKGTPAAIVGKLNAAARAAMDTPALQTRMKELGAAPPPPDRRSPQCLQGFVEREIDKWAAAIKTAGLTPD
jgi:tripartite-type tricarboxylate transporter receptor subunit TctC